RAGLQSKQLPKVVRSKNFSRSNVDLHRRNSSGPLREAQPPFAIDKLPMHLLLVFDVRVGTDPAGGIVVGIPDQNRAADMPAVLSVAPAQSEFDLVRLSRCYRTAPALRRVKQVQRVDDLCPALTSQFAGHST